MRQSPPLVVSDFAIGLVFGVQVRQAGLSLMQALLMSSPVFGGGSQFVALSLWVAPCLWLRSQQLTSCWASGTSCWVALLAAL